MSKTKDKEIFSILIGDAQKKKELMAIGENDDASCSNSGSSESVARDQWSSKYEFLFSCISYSIGLGNLWRFPYKCYDNGGGAFLLPYIFFLIIAGMPLYFLELSLGQFSSQGPFGVWNISRLFVGLGYAMVCISFFCSIYYNVIVAWILHYLFYSLKAVVLNEKLPWQKCFESTNGTGGRELVCDDSQRYWKEEVLQETSDISDFGGFQYEILICFIIAWILVCAILIKGVKSSGKITYFTALFPYVIIACLLWRGLTLDGAMDGLKFYLTPRWEKLLDPAVWNSAASQIFYSLGLAFGSLTTLSSYSPFKNDTLKMTFIVTTVNCATSIVAGVVIFAVIGSLAKSTGVPVDEVVKSGPGLAFVVYPDAVTKMPFSALWAALFFFMLLNLGFGSQLAMVETVITSVVDRVPRLLKYKWAVCIACCTTMLILGLPMTSRSGIYWLNFMDTYSCSYSLFVICLVEVCALAYIYGGRRMLIQIEAMIGYYPGYWWLFTWTVTVPVSIFTIFLLNMWFYAPMEYPAGQPIPFWTQALGWLLASVSVVFIPICAINEFLKVPGSFFERLDILVKPSELYRPRSEADLKHVNMLFERDSHYQLCDPSIFDRSNCDGIEIASMGSAASGSDCSA
jgi:solute carrier family 6 amino acid transporter-like protein 5/7/9/14